MAETSAGTEKPKTTDLETQGKTDEQTDSKTTEAADEANHDSTTEKNPKDTDLQQENKENSPGHTVAEKIDLAPDSKEKMKTVPVPLKLVHSHYTSHSKSTLPHILMEYGLEDKDHHQPKKKEKLKKKKRTKKTESGDETEDEDRPRRKATEKRLVANLGETQLDNDYYAQYIDFLEQKVQQQRQKQKERDEAAKLATLRAQEESDSEPEPPLPVVKKEEAKHRLVRRLERVELRHDDSFLKDLPRTDTARILLTPTFRSWIVVLQDKMKREGKLKTQADVDKFWRDIRQPDVFYQYFKVQKTDAGLNANLDTSNYNSSANEGSDDNDVFPKSPVTLPDMPPRSLSHISEASNRDTWAITQKYNSNYGPKSPKSPKEKKRKGSTQMAKEAAMDLEIRCPKLEMPPLACFSLNLAEKPPDPDEIIRKVELKARQKSRKKHERKLNKMYQMAMTNTAASNRILAQHKDLTNILEGATLRDVLSVFDVPGMDLQAYYRRITDPRHALEAQHPGGRILEAPGATQPRSLPSSAGSRKLTPIDRTGSRKSSKTKKKKTPEALEYKQPMPLSFDEIFTREKTLEPKCVSTLWTNYMHAGKSAFAAHS
ncbi:uncharacterized protein LOC127853199 isoform X3 [Dreissena polymorpha]|uniref:uncharacterized protein LOC127853199 isoform X3 n=1 Tax=Dreissena polymorpha TaxID=45954 RepID=UPI00226458AA|nr:uncharacterized protein LOC127853199 isoform X3 [Dreissena polymorpha]